MSASVDTPAGEPAAEPTQDDVFDMLADRTRREILSLLNREGRLPASGVAAEFPFLSRTAVSAKLSQLRRAGLVAEMRQGSFRFYSLARVRPHGAVHYILELWGNRPRAEESPLETRSQ